MALALISLSVGSLPLGATTNPETLPFTQNWANTTLITTNDDWAGVPGVIGYRGDDLTTATGTDPQTILADGSATPVNVIANQTSPNTLTTGGVAEFQITDPVVALNGSGTADAPHVVLTLDTSGLSNITVAYNLRDIDGSVDNAVQPVALQYRVGAAGSYTTVPAGFVADASTGPSLATQVTAVNAVLPAAVNNQPLVQVRVMTANAVGNDEWIGVDDISVTGTTNPTDIAPSVSSTSPTDGASNVPVNADITVNFSEPVTLAAEWYGIFCGTSGGHTATVSGGPQSFTINPDTDFAPSETCDVTIKADHVSDQDADDPPDNMVTNKVMTFTTTAAPSTPIGVVISQVYGGGGNAGAPLTNDFIELFNRSTTPVSLAGSSVQYASSAGTTWQVTSLTNVTLQPRQYYLVQEAAGTSGGATPPAPDATGTIPMSATAGKVALVGGTTPLSSCTGSSIADFVGYGAAASCFEGSGPAPAPSNTTADLRNGNGCVDTNNNASDFAIGAPNPRNTASPLGNCDDQPPSVTTTTPASGAVDVAVNASITIQFSEPVNVADGWYSISCATSGAHTATASGGPQSFTLNPDSDFATNESCTVTVVAANVTDQDTIDPPDTMSGNYVWSFTTETPPPPPVAIHDIQGASHTSPKVGAVSNVNGIVTAKRSNGFYMQDPNPDADDATSEGIFVFTSSAPGSVNVGDAVRVNGNVTEFRPGGASSTNLTTTEIASPSVTVLSSGNTLPTATVVGIGGRVPPGEVIEDDASGSVETSGTFDPANDGIDYYESLEGMRLQVNNPVVVGPRSGFGEIFVLADDGAGASVRTARGGILLRGNDANPERIQLDDEILPGSTPNASVGDHFTNPAVGIVDYSFGNFEVNLTSALTTVPAGLAREVTTDPSANQLAVATFNVENLDANEPQSKFDALAGEIVTNLRSPDVISLEEIQDNNGATNDSVVDASQTYGKLIASISAAGGPTYDFRQINPVDDQDGGEPGGNIRVGFLFRTDRGLAFVDRSGGDSTTPTTIENDAGKPRLSASPGRVAPTNAAWNSSRKPLAGEFTFHGQTFFLIANHFNSKGGDHPLFGRFQPPVRSSETQRHQQAQLVNDFVDSILALDTNAKVIVLGDINDFEFSQTVSILKGGVLEDLMDTLPLDERYSYVFEGNSQVLDHILVSNNLFVNPREFDPVHVNAEFFDQLSDHDPSVARFTVNSAPSVDAGGPYSVDEGGTVTLSATGSDPDGGTLTFEWDLDNNGSFETPGQTATFSAAGLDGPSTGTVRVRATDPGGLFDVDDATVTIENVAPDVTPPAGGTAGEGTSSAVALGSFSDPGGSLDAPYAVSVNWGDGSAPSTTTASAPGSIGTLTHTYDDNGTYHVTVTVTDKDGASDGATFDVSVANVPPTATFNAPATAPAGFPFTLSLSSPHDPSTADTTAGFTYAFDCGDGGGYGPFGSSSSTSCPTSDVGARSVGGKISDKDGGVTEYRATVQVTVTFASLCDLVRSYSTDSKVADELCDKLGKAETAPTPGARAGHLDAFRNQVDAKTGSQPGKAYTEAQAALLNLLSTRL